MNSKAYSEEMKQKMIEREIKENENLLKSMRKLQRGENVSVKDLDRVKEYMKKQSFSHEQGLNINHLAIGLEEDIDKKKKSVSKNREALKRRRLNQERVRRMRRIHQNEIHQEKELEI